MASPEQRQQHRQDPTQYEPLLGQTGDVGHLKEDGIYRNLFTGGFFSFLFSLGSR